ncbi:hypothetical protein KSS87_002724 [Heliosperma pusillum]|nr:hypothetical protein KSS87_002724 [Heliosperma pusillum]
MCFALSPLIMRSGRILSSSCLTVKISRLSLNLQKMWKLRWSVKRRSNHLLMLLHLLFIINLRTTRVRGGRKGDALQSQIDHKMEFKSNQKAKEPKRINLAHAKCYNCEKKGHFAQNCPEQKRIRGRASTQFAIVMVLWTIIVFSWVHKPSCLRMVVRKMSLELKPIK